MLARKQQAQAGVKEKKKKKKGAAEMIRRCVGQAHKVITSHR
jgi:predicted house-cleaning NTP pyrophosphatase (Maf/HAM1 superfamily)